MCIRDRAILAQAILAQAILAQGQGVVGAARGAGARRVGGPPRPCPVLVVHSPWPLGLRRALARHVVRCLA
eukprot:7442226-Lingulodinium_polyedra.AAC.1